MKKQILLLFAALMLSLGASAQMMLSFEIKDESSKTVKLPLSGNVSVTIAWGDGTESTHTKAESAQHYFNNVGKYLVMIFGSLDQFGGRTDCELKALTAVASFGELGINSLAGAFYNAENLTQAPNTLPATVTNLSGMFTGCKSFVTTQVSFATLTAPAAAHS